MAVSRIRRPAVAGYFYPRQPQELRGELSRFTQKEAARIEALGAIVPHAGFQYSGAIAGETLSRLILPSRCVILGPNHTGIGQRWSLMAEGAYSTPLGEVPIADSLACALLKACPLLVADQLAHEGEHAIEVELPFLQWLGPDDLSIVPIVIGSDDQREFDQVACALADVARQSEEPVFLLASSDLTHYEARQEAARKDAQAIQAIEALDEARFLKCIHELRMSICGYGPIACVLGAARRLGATCAKLVHYGSSADAGGDPHSVVGYAGIIIERV